MGTQTFAMADANVCIRGCIYLHPGKHIFKGPKRDALQTTLSWLPRGKKTSRKAQKLHTCAFLCNFPQRIPNDFLHKRDEMCMAILYFEQERRIFQTIILQAFRLFFPTIWHHLLHTLHVSLHFISAEVLRGRIWA